MNEVIICSYPECKAENPANAKFCRMCGRPLHNDLNSRIKYRLKRFVEYLSQPIEMSASAPLQQTQSSSQFTPDTFPDIKLSPCSVVNIDFRCRGLLILLILLSVGLTMYFVFQYDVNRFLYYNFNLGGGVVPVSLIGLITLLFIPFIIRVGRWMKYKLNADYIETSNMVQKLCRIAKSQKLGLYDQDRRKVILRTRYDKISMFGTTFILIERKGKKGVYSVTKKKLIIPIRFDNIDSFENSIAKCIRGTKIYYYDINGHRMQ